jgi:hypothetical protein
MITRKRKLHELHRGQQRRKFVAAGSEADLAPQKRVKVKADQRVFQFILKLVLVLQRLKFIVKWQS